MLRAIHTSATGMAAQEANVNNISNNIANINTVGFKKSRVEFDDLMYETLTESGARSDADTRYNIGTQIGSGAKVSATRRIHSSGSFQKTERPYDLMIDGDGFFGVILPSGELRFTRDGSFNVDNQGALVTRKGYKIFPGMTIPSGAVSININSNGLVEVYEKGNSKPQEVATIPIFNFTNPVGLKNMGGNILAGTPSSGEAIQQVPGENKAGSIVQGALEASNVSMMNEMTNLIRAQRAYEMNSKVMNVADQMLQTVNNIK
ncbi:MAG: flagellar basal-body rod protein FlgG [Bacteriovoracales bacterium]|nr:flagellar basal-body rod protein FlgG [Bacteriovoracales bacterium]